MTSRSRTSAVPYLLVDEPGNAPFPGVLNEIYGRSNAEGQCDCNRTRHKVERADNRREYPAGPAEILRGLGQEFPRECRKPVHDNVLQDDDQDGKDNNRCKTDKTKGDHLDLVLGEPVPAEVPCTQREQDEISKPPRCGSEQEYQ